MSAAAIASPEPMPSNAKSSSTTRNDWNGGIAMNSSLVGSLIREQAKRDFILAGE